MLISNNFEEKMASYLFIYFTFQFKMNEHSYHYIKLFINLKLIIHFNYCFVRIFLINNKELSIERINKVISTYLHQNINLNNGLSKTNKVLFDKC